MPRRKLLIDIVEPCVVFKKKTVQNAVLNKIVFAEDKSVGFLA